MTVCRLHGKPFQYLTNHQGALSFSSLLGRLIKHWPAWLASRHNSEIILYKELYASFEGWKVKQVKLWLLVTHLRVTERHLPYVTVLLVTGHT